MTTKGRIRITPEDVERLDRDARTPRTEPVRCDDCGQTLGPTHPAGLCEPAKRRLGMA